MKLSVEIVTSVTLAEWSGYGQFSISHNPGAKVRWHHPTILRVCKPNINSMQSLQHLDISPSR